MQKFVVLFILLVVTGACAQTPPPTATPRVNFVPVTATPTEIVLTPTVDRSVENGQPLAARVNGQPILLSDFEAQVAELTGALEASGVAIDEVARTRVLVDVLQALVDRQIIEQYAAQIGITVPATELEAAAQQLTRLNATQFEAWLADNNLTNQQFLDELRVQLLANKTFEHVTRDAPPAAEQIRLQLLLIDDPAVADQAVALIAQGKTFETLAAEQQFKSDYLDWFPRQANLVPQVVEDVAFSLQPGDISGPIQTESGYFIIKLEGKEAGHPLNQETIQQLKQQIFDAWLQKQRETVAVEPFVALP